MAETYDITAAFVAELAAHGLQHACISPGSRSTPLALAIARHPAIRHWVHHDERSAGFFALGAAKTTARPVAVVTTSGTAAAELYPAVIEASFGRVPLLLLTADRPPALRGTGANQTIDQVELYGRNVKWFHDAPLATVTDGGATRAMAARAWGEAVTDPSGPVHINFPFDEPLMPGPGSPAPAKTDPPTTWTAPSHAPDEGSLRALADLVEGTRGVLIAGPDATRALPAAVTDLARATGFPVLADPLSGVRVGSHDLSQVVGHYDALAQAGYLDANAPETAIRFGAVPTSKALNMWLAAHPETAYAVVEVTGLPDPGGTARAVVASSPARVAGELAKLVTAPAPDWWLPRWLAADARAAAALHAAPAAFDELQAVATIVGSVPQPAIVWVASSMPIRQVDLMLSTSSRSVRLLANRGASGIDGFISSGIGSAVSGDDPTYLVAGDLSALHDLTALGWAGRHHTDLTIIVINNDGGGIFHLLPQASLPEFEELFATPHGLDFAAAAQLFGLQYSLVTGAAELAETVSRPPAGPRLLEARFDRDASARAYQAAVERVRDALRGGK